MSENNTAVDETKKIKTTIDTHQPTAFITGFTGQDGHFLTKLLLTKGYKVVGLVRRVSTEPPQRTRGLFNFNKYLQNGSLVLEQGDLLSTSSLIRIISKHRPQEIYNLAAQSHVGVSFYQPEFTTQVDYVGVINLITALEAVELNTKNYEWRLYQASTSEMYGNGHYDVLNENTPLEPTSPYAIAKTAAHNYCKMKRKEGKYVACGILFNHESEIRGGDFVTQKISHHVAKYHLGQPTKLILGNLETKRDWGYAGDYVLAMHKMLQLEQPDDFVIATGQSHSVKEFVETALRFINKEIQYEYSDGPTLQVRGYVDGELFLETSSQFYRPVDVETLLGDSTRAKNILEWEPNTSFYQLVAKMVQNQIQDLSTDI